LATKFAAAFGVAVDLQFDGRSRPGDPPYQQADISKLSAMGFAPSMTLEQGLADYANWLRIASRDPGLRLVDT
jgi:nucleoside-diphosphate-sugar epimerase